MSRHTSSLAHRGIMGPLQTFQRAIAFHEQGRLWEAEQLYQAILRAEPRHFAALYRLGLLCLQQQRFEDAADLLRRAVKADKNSADAYHYLGIALTGLN